MTREEFSEERMKKILLGSLLGGLIWGSVAGGFVCLGRVNESIHGALDWVGAADHPGAAMAIAFGAGALLAFAVGPIFFHEN